MGDGPRPKTRGGQRPFPLPSAVQVGPHLRLGHLEGLVGGCVSRLNLNDVGGKVLGVTVCLLRTRGAIGGEQNAVDVQHDHEAR